MNEWGFTSLLKAKVISRRKKKHGTRNKFPYLHVWFLAGLLVAKGP